MAEKTIQNAKEIAVVCSCCGKLIYKSENPESVVKADYLHISKTWNYFSERDGETDECDICEACFARWTAGFVLPPATREETELI